MLHSAIDEIDLALDNFFGATNLVISKPELSKPSLVTYSVGSWTYFLRSFTKPSLLSWSIIALLIMFGIDSLGFLATKNIYKLLSNEPLFSPLSNNKLTDLQEELNSMKGSMVDMARSSTLELLKKVGDLLNEIQGVEKKYEEFTKKYEELMSKYKTYDKIPYNEKYEFLKEYPYIYDNQNTEPIIIIRL